MKNKYFPEEEIDYNDLLFICFMIEKVARSIHQPNRYVVNAIGCEEFVHLLSVAKALHCENPLDVVDDWKEYYKLEYGQHDVTAVDAELCPHIPSALDMGKVYARLILQTLGTGEDYAQGVMRVYNDDICQTLDNYSCSAYYEPSYYIAESYRAGGFF